jgi:type VI secretion system protein ImpL
MKRWLILSASFIAVLLLCVLIWFVFPLVAIAGVEPFDNAWLRLAMIVLLLALFFGILAYRIHKQRKSAEELAANIVVQELEDDNSDASVLAEKMQDALITLKGSQRTKGDFLYELPWYMIVGPPGAGKTTALMNCGLKFPIAAHANGPVAGSGGTRYCDWWFTEEAVFIDTAGRYTTQDSDSDVDRKSWLSFLDLLKKHRTRQPINGVLVAISIGDILGGSQAELGAHAVAIRKRLTELNNRLQVDFPVYVLFTKADLIAGFMEYFGNLDEQKRKLVWGATFQTSNKKENHVAEAGGEIELLISRLTAELPDRLQEEPDPVSRVRLVGFPTQLMALKPMITDFLNQIFEPTRYQTSATLRGFYLTSGTQEGTPIDRVLGSLSRNMGLGNSMSAVYSGRARSYFLEHLLTKVVFGEAGWVSTNANAVRRKLLLRAAAYGLIGLITFATLGGWLNSYVANNRLIAATNAASHSYANDNATLIRQDPIDEADFQKIVPPLNALRNFPRGFATAEAPVKASDTLGLGQHRRISVAASSAYETALNRLLRPRIILHLEKRLADLQDKPEQLYEPLKVYMMLSGDPTIPVDTALIFGWMQGDWESLYPGEPNKPLREALKQHLEAMLDISAGTFRPIALNGDLVAATQKALARLTLAERAFALIKSTAHDPDVPDWTLVQHAGPDASSVFATRDGAPLESVGVPAVFTYDGFYKLFLAKMNAVMTLLQSERWVLGDAGGKENLDKQFAGLGPDLFKQYDDEFIKAWSGELHKLKLRSFVSDAPNYNALRAATGASSPIKLLLESVAEETKLTVAKAVPKDATADKLKKVAGNLATALPGRIGNMAEIGLDAAKKSDSRGGDVGKPFVPGAFIQEHFRRYHELTDPTGGKSQVDGLVDQLKGLYQSLLDEQKFEQATQAHQNMLQFLASLSTSTSRLEEPFSDMLKTNMQEFEQKIVVERTTDLSGQLAGTISQKCKDATSRFPFAEKSKNELPMTDFARVFGPNGLFDSFFREKLADLVDSSGPVWTWKQTSKLSQSLSPVALGQFQSATRIKDAFFTGQGTSPTVKFAIVMKSLGQNVPSATFEVNGVKLESPFGVETRGDFEWPGRSPDGTASVSLPVGVAGAPVVLQFSGPWALQRLLKAGTMRQSGNKATVQFIVGGREVTYQMTFDTLENPFSIISRVAFTCPDGL